MTSRIDEKTEQQPACDAMCLREGMKKAVKLENAMTASKAAVSETLEEGKISAQRILKRGRTAVEDCVEDTVLRVKRNPLGALTITFAAGALVGLLVPRGSKK